jgi:hypothetical protein
MLHLLSAALLLQVHIGTTTHADSARVAAAVHDTTHDDSTHGRRHRARRAKREPRRLPLTPALEASAYADARTRELILRARRARLEQDSSLLSYDATAYQRVSAGMGFTKLGRDRLVFRKEEVSRVRWRRGEGVWVAVKGSRMAIPIIAGIDTHDENDPDLDPGGMTPIPYYPGRDALWVGTDMVKADVDDRELVHPLANGAEAYYKYAIGDSIVFRLADGTQIRLVEVKIRAREPKWNVAVGSLWFDVATARLVRAGYRLAVPMDIAAVALQEEPDAFDDVPVWVKPMIFPMIANISAITIEYGLHEGRFWMPRVQTAEGEARVSFMRVPFKLEESFKYAQVNGRLDSLPPLAEVDTADAEVGTAYAAADSAGHAAISGDLRVDKDSAKRTSVSIDLQIGEGSSSDIRDHDAHTDSAFKARRLARKAHRDHQCADSGYYHVSRRRGDGGLRIDVRMPCDTTALAHSAELPPSIYEPGDELFGAEARDELIKALGFGAQAEWAPQRPVIFYGFDRGLLRYNRVEGLSAGVGVRQIFGAGYSGEALAQIGTADLQPNGEVSFARSNGRSTIGVGIFRRLGVANDWGSPLGFGGSMSSLLFGRDEGFYYRTWGAEVTGTLGYRAPVTWRLFAEQQSDADVETQLSVAHVFNGQNFLDNIDATKGKVAGGSLRATKSFGLDPHGFRLLSDFRAEAGAGDFDYARGALDLTASHGLGSWLDGALTVGAGTSGGQVPAQRLWYLGDSRTIRGQRAGIVRGDAYWLARAELGGSLVAARPVLFADLGWAGSRVDWAHPGRVVSGVGAGASLLDGLIRFDVSRGIWPRQGFRTDLYLEGRF